MAMKLGTLQVDITADTSGLRAAESEVTRTTRKMGDELGRANRLIQSEIEETIRAINHETSVLSKVDSALSAYGMETNSATDAQKRNVAALISKLSALERDEKATIAAANATARMQAAINGEIASMQMQVATIGRSEAEILEYRLSIMGATQAEKEHIKSLYAQAAAMKSVTAGSRFGGGASNVARQMGYQVQDVAVQLSMGTNAMTVLGQQGSQIASVFGPTGAVVGAFLAVGAAIGGALLPSLFKSKNATEELDEAMKKLGITLKEADDGTVILTEKFEKMASKSREAAELSLRGNLVTALEATKIAIKELAEAGDDFTYTLRGTGLLITEAGDRSADLAKKYGLTTDEALRLELAVRGATHEYSSNAATVAELQKVLNDLVSTQKSQAVGSTEGRKRLVEMAEAINSAAMKYADLTGQADALKTILGDVDGALAKSTETSIKNNDVIDKYIAKLRTEAETVGKTREELEKYNLEKMGLSQSDPRTAQAAGFTKVIVDFDAKQEEKRQAEEAKKRAEAEEKKRLADEENKKKQELSRIKQIEALGRSEREAIEFEYEETRKFILEQDQKTGEERQKLMDIIGQERIEKLAAVNKKEIDEAKKVRDATVQAAEDMTSGISGLMRASGDDQAARMAESIDAVANMAITMSTIYAAQAQASEMGSPANPTLAQKFAGVAAVMSMATSILTVIKSARGGGRQHGGTVSPMLAHPINEQGAPEILNSAGKQYLLPTGKGGTITPMKGGAGGGGVVVNLISNGTPQAVTGTSMSRGEVTVMIEDAVNRTRRDINSSLATGRGDTAASLKSGFEVRNRLR